MWCGRPARGSTTNKKRGHLAPAFIKTILILRLSVFAVNLWPTFFQIVHYLVRGIILIVIGLDA
jgi:hypothetical protein